MNLTEIFLKILNLKFRTRFFRMFVLAKIVSKQSIKSPFTILSPNGLDLIKTMVKN